MFLVFLLLFVGFTVAEFQAIFFVYDLLASRLGGFAAVVAIILSFLAAMSLGIRLIHKRASLLLQNVQMGKVLTLESDQGLLFFLAGFLLIIPGYVSDIFALLCLFPPTAWILKRVFRKLAKKMGIHTSRAFEGMAGRRTKYWYSQMPSQNDQRPSDPTIIDVEAIDSPKKLT